MPRKVEIIGITTEKCRLLFGCKSDPDVGIFLIAIEPVLPALIERDDVGAKSCLVETFFLNLCLLCLSRIESLLLRHSRLDGALNAAGDILHRNENVELEVGSLQLFRLCLRIKAVLNVISLRIRYLLKLAQSDVVIRYHETTRADE